MKKVVITGANGFIGSSLVKRLVRDNVEVFAIDINYTINHLPISPIVHCFEIGLDDKDKLKELLSPAVGCDAFYHLAWRGANGPDKTKPSIQLDNAKMVMDCAEVAKSISCKRFLCAGTVAEQSVNSLSNLSTTSGGMMYGVVKHCTYLILETFCKNIGQPFIWLQFSNIYGAGNKTGNLVSYTLGELLKGNNATFGPAAQPYDFIYVDDLIEAVYRIGDKDTSRNFFFIGSGAPRVLKEYLLDIGRISGKSNAIKIGERPDDGIRYDFDMFDTTPLREMIGDYASTSFEDGIIKTINWLKEQ